MHHGHSCAGKCLVADPLAQHVEGLRKYLILQLPRIVRWNNGQESQSLLPK